MAVSPCLWYLDTRQIRGDSDKDMDMFKGRMPGVEDGLIDAIRGEGEKDIKMFKGRLHGVEDELIDALVYGTSSSRLTTRNALRHTTSSHWYSPPKSEMRKERLLGAEDQLTGALTLPVDRHSDAFMSPRVSEALIHYYPEPSPGSEGGLRCKNMDSNTAGHHIWCTCAVAIEINRFDSVASGVSQTSTNSARMSMDVEEPTMESDTPTTLFFDAPLPSTEASEVLGAEPITAIPDYLVIDSIIFEKPVDTALLGAWDVGNWWAVEAIMGELLMAG